LQGAATYSLNGVTDGPGIASVILRAGWSFPGGKCNYRIANFITEFNNEE